MHDQPCGYHSCGKRQARRTAKERHAKLIGRTVIKASYLKGLKVIDLGIITAGASTSSTLADLGADVIKVEGPDYLDPFRSWGGASGEARWWDYSPQFNFTNRNKRSLCVDLKKPEGRQILLDLVRMSDIVVENFRVGVLDRLQLSFTELVQVNPQIILASISSQGQTGPDAQAVSFGSTLEGASGISSLIRYPQEAPQISGHALNYPDQVVSLFAVGAILTAIVNRTKTGRGAHLDLSQRELSCFMLGEYLLAALDGVCPQNTGSGAPALFQALVRTQDEKWLAVTLPTRECVIQLAERFNTERPVVSEAVIGVWAQRLTAQDAIEEISAAGGAAEIARTVYDLSRADGLLERSLALVRDSAGGLAKGLPWRTGQHTLAPVEPCPALGADNKAVLVDVLGRSESEYERLVAQGVLTSTPRACKPQ